VSGGDDERPWKLLTIRVSRDSGRTYGEPIEYLAGDYLPPIQTNEWPPCQCPKHRAARAEGRELPQTSRLRFDGS
jgi:hypothetical protein